jgi:Flp pilus assembly protein TadG
MSTRMAHRHRDRGSVSLEVLALVPVIFLLVYLAIAAGQIAYAKAVIQEAAQKEARIISMARDRPTAFNSADIAYNNFLNSDSLGGLCGAISPPAINGFAFSKPPATTGGPSLISVTISCQVDLSALPFSDLQAVTVTATAYSPLDPYRYHGVTKGSG